MIVAPVQVQDPMLITSDYGEPRSDGRVHRGVDLRNKDMQTGHGLSVTAPENGVILRFGTGRFGEHFIVMRGLESHMVLKLIHTMWTRETEISQPVHAGDILGVSDNSGYVSKGVHLHFETWAGDESDHVDPKKYFDRFGLRYAYKHREAS